MRSILFFLTLSLSLPLFAAETDLTSAIESVRTGHFEPALESLTKLESESFLTENPTQAAEYWFYRAVCEHQLFQKEACAKSLDQLDALAEKPDFELPARFSALSRLMRKDLETLKDESLEMISRRMKGVERQLGHGNGDEKVQKSEEEIVEMLDNMIEELEEQAKKMQKRMQSSLKSGKPMGDAKIAGGKGPGNVTRRDLDFSKAWGSLPEKEREEVLQQLGRDFPPHYRDAIEQYFKRMAE
ncbi:MAG: hypothetical protein IJK97_00650 [Thermoguttaceae bacterium]|nr:hypothetical protein [Thermoguttaceae bacterium]MBR0193612.1 hypothetical protein [Thermoguttaceae bacterium]